PRAQAGRGSGARAARDGATLPRAVPAHRAAPRRERPHPGAIEPGRNGRALGGGEAAARGGTRGRRPTGPHGIPDGGRLMTEMTTDRGREAALFLQLLLGLQQAAMVALGKLMSPMSGKLERNLEAARNTIDTLAAIEARTRNNLEPDEQRVLVQV